MDVNPVCLAQLVQGDRRCNTLNYCAPLLFLLQQVLGQDGERIQGSDEPAMFVDDSHPVSVAVQGYPDGRAVRCYERRDLGQIVGDGFWLLHTGESRVTAAMELSDGGLAAGQECRQVSAAGPVHGIHDHIEPGALDGVQVHQRGYSLHIWTLGLQIHDQAAIAALSGVISRTSSGLSDEPFKTVGYLLGGAAGVLGFEFEPVPLARIVTGGDNRGATGLMMQDVVAENRGWGGLIGQIDLNPLGGAYGGHSLSELG